VFGECCDYVIFSEYVYLLIFVVNGDTCTFDDFN